jgi:hypothetical protein
MLLYKTRARGTPAEKPSELRSNEVVWYEMKIEIQLLQTIFISAGLALSVSISILTVKNERILAWA